MNDVMVSIRMPASMISKLKDRVKDSDFMDLSEAIRSLVRKKWQYGSRPELSEIKQLRERISEELRKRSEKLVSRQVVSELEKIQSRLVKEELLK